MTTFLHRTGSSNEHYNGDGDYALVTITPEDARRYLKLIERAGALKNEKGFGTLYRLVFWDATVYFVPGLDGEDWMEEAWDAVLTMEDTNPRIAVLQEKAIRTECDMLNVTDDSIYWTAYVKGTSVLLNTDSVRRQQLEEIARGREAQ